MAKFLFHMSDMPVPRYSAKTGGNRITMETTFTMACVGIFPSPFGNVLLSSVFAFLELDCCLKMLIRRLAHPLVDDEITQGSEVLLLVLI